MKKILLGISAVSLCFFIACLSFTTMPGSTNNHSQFQLTSDDYTIIGTVEAKGTIHMILGFISWGGNGYAILEKKAREIGGDGIMNYYMDSKSKFILGIYVSYGWEASATVIKYKNRVIDRALFEKNQKLIQQLSEKNVKTDGRKKNDEEFEKEDGKPTAKAFLIAVSNGDKIKVKSMIDLGADVNWKNTSGDSALIVSIAKGNIEIAKMLIEKGANVNAKNSSGATALMWAANQGNIELVKVLILKKADVNQQDYDNSTALMYAESASQKDIVDILKKAGAKK